MLQEISTFFQIDSNNLMGLIVPLIISILLIVIGIDEEYCEHKYQKKYIFTIYGVFSFITLFSYSKNVFFIILLGVIIYLLISILGAINLAYDSDSLAKKLSEFDLFIFKFFEWIIYIKSYLFLIYFLILNLLLKYINFSSKNISYNKFYYFLVGIFILFHIIYHTLSNAQDTFKYKKLDIVRNTIIDNVKTYNQKYDISDKANPVHAKNISMMCFIIYMEDRDLFDRNGFNFSFPAVKKRKKVNNEKFNLKFKSNKRGFSTIPQQLIRRISLCAGADNNKNTLRRKIFIGFIYTPIFLKVYLQERKIFDRSIHGNQLTYNINMLKVDILKNYFIEISQYPETEEELFIIMRRNSRVRSQTLYKKYYNDFINSPEKQNYFKIIEEYYYRGPESK